jgi:hypothetical protein
VSSEVLYEAAREQKHLLAASPLSNPRGKFQPPKRDDFRVFIDTNIL